MVEMAFLILSFIAGVLTILAPCILPLLPVILAGSVTETTNRRRPFIIIGSLSISVFIFTLLLKGTTAIISLPPTFWSYVSALILLAFGLTLIFPETWARIVLKIPGHNKPDRWISKGYGDTHSLWTDVIIGAALGPVFTTCSPTFFVILATVLPQSFAVGIVDLLGYIVGLALALMLVAWIGQRLVDKLAWATNPYGWFKKTLGVIFILIAVAIAFGFDKKIESRILTSGFFDVTRVEQSIKEYVDAKKLAKVSDADQAPLARPVLSVKELPGVRYTEFVGIAGYINTDPVKLADVVGKKVILVDFIDYTCINCQRTFPYMNDWYARYKDQGLEIIAIHTPEFSFEKDKSNVEKGARQFGLKFPIVLDNDYATWNAYRNQYWPHKYLIDIHGNVVYDHAGEGAYAETERTIVGLLNERKMFLNEPGVVMPGTTAPAPVIQARSPETYFGAARNDAFGNGRSRSVGQDTFILPNILQPNYFYLEGSWKVESEYAENITSAAQLSFVFNAANMYIVARSADGTAAPARVLIDGKPISASMSGSDVSDGMLQLGASRLYHLFKSATAGQHRIDIIFTKPGAQVFTFTFG